MGEENRENKKKKMQGSHKERHGRNARTERQVGRGGSRPANSTHTSPARTRWKTRARGYRQRNVGTSQGLAATGPVTPQSPSGNGGQGGDAGGPGAPGSHSPLTSPGACSRTPHSGRWTLRGSLGEGGDRGWLRAPGDRPLPAPETPGATVPGGGEGAGCEGLSRGTHRKRQGSA